MATQQVSQPEIPQRSESAPSPPVAGVPPIGNRALVAVAQSSMLPRGVVDARVRGMLARQAAVADAAPPVETREEKIEKFAAALSAARDATGSWKRVAVILNG